MKTTVDPCSTLGRALQRSRPDDKSARHAGSALTAEAVRGGRVLHRRDRVLAKKTAGHAHGPPQATQ